MYFWKGYMLKNEIRVSGKGSSWFYSHTRYSEEDSWVTEGEVVRIFRAIQSRLAPVPSPSFWNPPPHGNRFNPLLLPPLFFTPSHYSSIYCCLMLFSSLPDASLFPTCTSHFLESREEDSLLTFLFSAASFPLLHPVISRGGSWR
jgi:hypothetical protein